MQRIIHRIQWTDVAFAPMYLPGCLPLNLTCPTCNNEFSVERKEDAPFRPFCSKRCKFVDLGRWLDGTYSIPEALPGAQSMVDQIDKDQLSPDSDEVE